MVQSLLLHPFVGGIPFSHIGLRHEAQLFKRAKRSIHRRDVDVGVLFLDLAVNVVRGQVARRMTQRAQDHEALRGRLMARIAEYLDCVCFATHGLIATTCNYILWQKPLFVNARFQVQVSTDSQFALLQTSGEQIHYYSPVTEDTICR